MNIIVSGWPGAGSTTFSMLLAYILDYKYVYSGGVMKFLAQKITGQTSGPDFVNFEHNYGPYFDLIWEKYSLWKLKNSDQLLVEGKTTGFLVDSEKVFEIMLIAQIEIRKLRASKDGRVDAENTIVARDEELKKRWLTTYGIDIFDPTQIQYSYDLVLDNSNLPVTKELELTLSYLEEDYRFPGNDLSRAKDKLPNLVAELQIKGKQHYLDDMHKRKLVVDIPTIFKEWKKHFAAELALMPDQIKQVVEANL